MALGGAFVFSGLWWLSKIYFKSISFRRIAAIKLLIYSFQLLKTLLFKPTQEENTSNDECNDH